MMTVDEGLIITCLLPLFSALYMFFRASFSTFILTILLSYLQWAVKPLGEGALALEWELLEATRSRGTKITTP